MASSTKTYVQLPKELLRNVKKGVTETVIWQKRIEQRGEMCEQCGEQTYYLGIAPRIGLPSIVRVVFYCVRCSRYTKRR